MLQYHIGGPRLTEHTFRVFAGIDSNQHRVARLERLSEPREERGHICTREVAQARTKPKDSFGFSADLG